jgi:hypothetical protein
MDEDAIRQVLDRVAPKRRRDSERGIFRAALHDYLKAGTPEVEAMELARRHITP